MDLFHFDTSNLEPAEVDFVVATLQKRDRRHFVKLPWDRKAKAAVLRQQPAEAAPARRRSTAAPPGGRQASTGSRHGGTWSSVHIPNRSKPPRLQRAQQRDVEGDGGRPLPQQQQPFCLAPTSAAQLLGEAAYAAGSHMPAGPTPFVMPLHHHQQQPRPHQEPTMGRYYLLPGSDEASGLASPPVEICINYVHGSPGGMVVGMPSIHHGSDVPSPPPGAGHHHHHHSHALVMPPPPGSLGVPVHGSGYAMALPHLPSTSAAVLGHYPMQPPPYLTAADLQPQPTMYYQCLPTVASSMAGAPRMDGVYAQQGGMFHHPQLPMPPQYPPAGHYSVPAAVMMTTMGAVLPPGSAFGCEQDLAASSQRAAAEEAVLPPRSENSLQQQQQWCLGSDDPSQPTAGASHPVVGASELPASSSEPSIPAPSAVQLSSKLQRAAADAEAFCPARPAPDDCAQQPAFAAAVTAALAVHSRQSSSSSATSDELLQPDSSCALGKVYERRNKKKRPADFYQRQGSADAPADTVRQSVAVEQPGQLLKEGACTKLNSPPDAETRAQEPLLGASTTLLLATAAGAVDQSSGSALADVQQPLTAESDGGTAAAAVATVSVSVTPVAASSSAKAAASDPIIGSRAPSAGREESAAAAAAAQSSCAKDAPSIVAAAAPQPPALAPVATIAAPAPLRAPSSAPAAATMSWAQRVQMQSGRASGGPLHVHDASQRAAATGSAAPRIAVELPPPTTPHSGDLGALLAAFELSSRPYAVHPRGFVNKGNWCYANATLQALLACPVFYNFLASLPKDPALCAAGASKTPLLDTLVALCNEFSRFERGGTPAAASQTSVVATATAQPTRAAGAAATVGQQQASSKARQQLLDLKPGPPLEPTIVTKLVQAMLSKSGAQQGFAHGKQEDAEEFHSALLDKLHSELLSLIQATTGSIAAIGRPETTATSPLASAGAPPANQTAAAAEVDTSVNGEVEWARVGPKNKHVVTRTADLARSPVTAIFGGKLLSSVTQVGSSKTANVEPFLAVQLEIQSDDITSVTKALNALAKRETIDGYTCSKTRQEIETHRRMVFEELPQVLILHLKCFVYDKNGLQKITKKIEFGDTLNFSSDLLAFPNKYTGQQRTYKLCAVVHHSGTAATGGHYTTDAFHSGVNCWVRYDDSNISVVSSQSVFEFAAPRMPYLLYYQRVDLFSTA